MPDNKEKKAAPAKQETKGSAKSLRLVAIILWVLAVGAEIGAIYLLKYDYRLLIGALVLDAILVIIGAQLWKRANRIKPCASKSKFVKMLWDQMGVIAALVAFIPFAILFILNAKSLPKKTRNIIAAVLTLLFLGTVSSSIDYNPPSPDEAEAKAAAVKEQLAEEGIEYDGVVYWTTYGKSYHLDRDCFTLNRTTEENLRYGTLEEAFAAGRTDPCDFCALPEEEE
ncbi:MAG: hypothetical protein AB1Z19_00270, partial [Eubacteriales bacterium]